MADAIVVGSGPNGLAAAIVLAQAGCSVQVYEAENTIGGGARSAGLTLPGCVHDLCSAVHPLALAAPFFRTLPLERHGLEWIHPGILAAHPLDEGDPALLYRSIDETARGLGGDGGAYTSIFRSLAGQWTSIDLELLSARLWPRNPLALLKFGAYALRPAANIARGFREPVAQALFAGMAAHSGLPLDKFPTGAIALVLMIAGHAVGWPIPKGGAQSIANALASFLRSLGGQITTGHRVRSLSELPPARAILFDVTPRQLLSIAGDHLPATYRRALQKFRYGPGAFKMDWVLSQPVPWQNPQCARAGTLHLGGTFKEIALSEKKMWEGEPATNPFVLLSQPTQFDPGRAPAGKHILWGYCHVPHGSQLDMSSRIEYQIERFAPGFRDCILARAIAPPDVLEARNANLIGGDINGGLQDWRQLFTRPTWRRYATPDEQIYLCSSSTPPGGGVHGMCGFNAANLALKKLGLGVHRSKRT